MPLRLSVRILALCLVSIGAAAIGVCETFLGVEKGRIERIMSLGYNLDPEMVEEIDALAREFPGSPVPDLLRVGRLYWLTNYAEANAALNESFEKVAEEALEKAKEYLDEHEDDPDAKFLVAMIELTQVIYFVDNKRYWAAFWKSRPSVRAMKRLIKEYPDYHDAKMPLGMANCYLSRTPGYLKPLALLMRFDSDWEKGVRYMQEAKEFGLWTKVDAGYYLGAIRIELEGDREAAKVEFEELVGLFPQNVKFQSMLAEFERSLGQHEKSKERALLVIESPLIGQFPMVEFRTMQSLLWSSLGAGDFDLTIRTADQAEEVFSRFDRTRDAVYWARHAKAEAKVAQGRTDEAIAIWEQLLESGFEPVQKAARQRLDSLREGQVAKIQ